MSRKYPLTATAMLLCLLFLTGCSNKKDNARAVHIDASKTTETTSVSTIENNSRSKNSETSMSTFTSDSAESSQSSSSSVISSSTSDTTESQAAENTAPFAVDTTQFSNPATFNLHGVNVPSSITVENNGGTIIFNGRGSNTDDVFAAQVTTIPTKEIRVSSQDGSGIRTVKANTQITLTQHLSGTGGQGRNNVMYLINNKNGGLSLLPPNYAGNVEPSQMDVMLEAVQ